MPPGTEVAAAYGRVTNQSDQTVVITAVSSSMGEAAQIHDVIADGDQRRMVQLDTVSLAAGESTEFKPGGAAHHAARRRRTAT
jgi:copper(I)-binding protein